MTKITKCEEYSCLNNVRGTCYLKQIELDENGYCKSKEQV